jgi:hypothetical protein
MYELRLLALAALWIVNLTAWWGAITILWSRVQVFELQSLPPLLVTLSFMFAVPIHAALTVAVVHLCKWRPS